MLPKELIDAIRDDAEKKYPFGDDFQNQVREHIKNDKLFNWDEALTDNEMTYLEQLLLTFKPDLPFNKRSAYISGRREQLERDLAFVEWMCKEGYDSIQIAVSPKWSKGFATGSYTTAELYMEYLKESNKK